METDKIESGMLLQDRYRVIRPIGQGGFAWTFEVDDRGTPKVLKVLHCKYPKAAELFEREAGVLLKLRHPGIPRVEADGYFTFVPDGAAEPLPCLVMEFIEGENLKKWVEEKGAIAPEVAVDWLKQLVVILEQLHQQKYFHRDIKPENIMRRPNGKLVLIDFGAVRGITDTYLAKISGDRLNTQIGSFGYWPPEQMDGKPIPQSDFFALGRTFVHLLAGKHPSDFTSNFETGELQWRKTAPQVPESLADLIDWLMAPFPGGRPQSAAIILQRLSAVSLGKQKTFEKLKLQKRPDFEWFLRSNTAKLALATSLMLGFICFKWLPREIAFQLNEIGYKNYFVNSEFSTAEGFFLWAVRLDPELGMAHYNLAFSCEKQEKIDCAKEKYQNAILLRKPRSAGRATNNLGHLSMRMDKNCREAVDLFEFGLSITKEISTKAILHKNLAACYIQQKKYKEAEEDLLKSISLEEDFAEVYCLLGKVRDNIGDKEGAIASYKKCINFFINDENNLEPEEKKLIDSAREYLDSGLTQRPYP